MSWKRKYPDWYKEEINELKSGTIYKEKYRWFDKILVSTGELLIRSKRFNKRPILIIYPKTTPFKPPKIYILNELLTNEEVESISKEEQNKNDEIVCNKKKLIYRRHQMSDGEVCFIESDNIYKNKPEIFHISDILERVRKWFVGIDKGKIPDDNAEVEFFSHFPFKTYELNILLPEIFYDPKLISGEFYLHKFNTVQERVINKKTYVGVQIVGQYETGLSSEPITDDMFSKVVNTKFAQSLDYILKKDMLNDYIKKEEVIEGSWWDIIQEPQPFGNMEDILKLLHSNEDEATKIFYSSQVFKNLAKYPVGYVGLRFKNRRGDLEWIIFRLIKKENTPFILSPSLDETLEVLKNYSLQIVKTDLFSDKQHHLRNFKRANRNILSKQVISIIGCGALGSEISDCLGKAGIGKLIFLDNQNIEPGNPIRHLCGLEKLYYPKSIAVGMHIFEHNPFIEVEQLFNDITVLNINDYVLDNGIAISSLANDNIEAYLNEQAIINNKTIFYSRVLRGGKVGRIFRVIPGVDACFKCLHQYKLEGNDLFLDIPEDKQYPTILNECNNPIRPASAADIKLIASITARIIIDYMQSDTNNYNHWIFSSESFDKFVINKNEFMSTKKLFIPPHPDCPLCNVKEKIKIRILKDVYEFMKNEVINTKKIETGGVLIGFKGKSNCIYICNATHPGPKAVRTEVWFERDIEYCQQILNEEYEKYGNKGIYIGEWHCHPSRSNSPSNRDLLSLSEIAESENYLVDEPVMLIFSDELKLNCTVHPIGKRYYETDYELIEGDRNEIQYV
ncbi:MAG: ThiF family adenylyltransferase [Ignavibacteriales bacterium]|nr:ThiF family adenylyltransferase [Ignavibacteriales bacterium]